MTALPPAERLARLRLARSDGIGAVGFRLLLERWGSAEAAVGYLAERRKPVGEAGAALREMEAAAICGARHLIWGDADYPPLLAELADPPPVLLVQGHAALAARPVVAMVGARNASAAGQIWARDMARALGQAGWVVASGLARGIDTAAHQGALETGTIACIASGPDIIYPPENKELQGRIAASGFVIGELPPGAEPQARHFPRRNRLIAGIAQGLVVIEAAQASGSLITARHAGEWGRDVMAVPGHPADPRSRGGNGLLKDGAILVETAEDVLRALTPFQVQPPAKGVRAERRARDGGLSGGADLFGTARGQPAEGVALGARTGGNTHGQGVERIARLLGVEGIVVDELVRLSGLSAGEVQAHLGDLEIEGRLRRLTGGRVALASD